MIVLIDFWQNKELFKNGFCLIEKRHKKKNIKGELVRSY